MEKIKIIRTYIYIVVSIFFWLLPTISWSQTYFKTDERVREIYRNIIELRLDKAKTMIREAKKEEENNLMLLHMENYVDFFSIFINEDLKEFKKLEENKSIRLNKIEKADPNDPYYLMVMAEIHMQWAISRLKFEEYYTALLEIRKALRLLEKNKERFPDFLPTNKGLAMIHAVVGTIPDNYKYLLKLFTGLEGDINEALEEIEALRDYADKNDFIFREEVYVIQSLIQLHLGNDKASAWKSINDANLDIDNGLLAVFIKANIANHCGKTDEAISILENRPVDKEFWDFHYLDLMLGINKLHRLEEDADSFLLMYVDNFKGRNYIKEAYQKLAWHSWVIKNDRDTALGYYNLCLRNGTKLIDEDESAHADALQRYLPDRSLLRARLLFDGAYYERSIIELESKKDFLIKHHHLIYRYTLARNFQMLNRSLEALDSYATILEMNEAENSYQKCNAALQSGLILEQLGEFDPAAEYFRLCLKLTPNKYEKSLHQKAKAGLNRLKK